MEPMDFELIDPSEEISKVKIAFTVKAEDIAESKKRIQKAMDEFRQSVRAEEAYAEQTAAETFLTF
jgi:hypothetical protein